MQRVHVCLANIPCPRYMLFVCDLEHSREGYWNANVCDVGSQIAADCSHTNLCEGLQLCTRGFRVYKQLYITLKSFPDSITMYHYILRARNIDYVISCIPRGVIKAPRVPAAKSARFSNESFAVQVKHVCDCSEL